jgi:dihydrodipicolinate synthase/N-acetylneuraminate lyase
MAPWVKGLLVPGSTGDGWELSPDESSQVVKFALDQVGRLDLHLLAGALRPASEDALRSIQNTLEVLKTRAGSADLGVSLEANRVCGFAICPPRGQERTQADLDQALSRILGLEMPCAIYQLPQVTQNEMGADLIASLAERFPNFILFKDTSGTDRVTSAGLDLGGVFLVRGAEGGYAQALKNGGGAYDGFLLSTANNFARQLHHVAECIAVGRADEAHRLSEVLSQGTQAMFGLVAGVKEGNPFANAGKAVDHFYAYGPGAVNVPPPRLHAGCRLPVAVIREAEAVLTRYGLMPARGYLE